MTGVEFSIQCHSPDDTVCFRREVDLVTEELCKPWDGVLNFLVCPFSTGVDTFPSFEMTFTQLNICSYLGSNTSPATHLYFDPSLYPPPPQEASFTLNKYQPWLNLKRDLMVAAHVEGNPICSNGYTRDKTMRLPSAGCYLHLVCSVPFL